MTTTDPAALQPLAKMAMAIDPAARLIRTGYAYDAMDRWRTDCKSHAAPLLHQDDIKLRFTTTIYTNPLALDLILSQRTMTRTLRSFKTCVRINPDYKWWTNDVQPYAPTLCPLCRLHVGDQQHMLWCQGISPDIKRRRDTAWLQPLHRAMQAQAATSKEHDRRSYWQRVATALKLKANTTKPTQR